MNPDNQYEAFRRKLDVKAMMQEAKQKAGLSDYGDEGFVIALGKFLDCAAKDVNYHAAGLEEFRSEVVRDLVNRLRFQDDLKHHPEILDEDVSDPVIIIGFPRSGTTKTQRMMGADPALHKTYMWQILNPAPFPDAVPGKLDPRIAAASGGTIPDIAEFQAAHRMVVDEVDEDWQLFEYVFNDWFQFQRTQSPSWHDWVLSRTEPSDLYNYRYVRSLIQYLQWQQGGRQGKRWLMKGCGHLSHIKELAEVHPKATIVHIHRHPAFCIPSYAKILFDVGGLRVESIDAKVVGNFVLDWEKISAERYMAARDRHGLNDRIIDVQYDQIRDDPMPVFREIYRRAGLALTAEAERGMLQWEKENEQGKHGKHNYSLEMFGLSEQKIDDAFGEYIRRFIRS